VSHAGDAAGAAELEKSELGQQVRLLLSEFDSLRAVFDLRPSLPRPSRAEMYIKMVLTLLYTLLSVIACLFLMPLRLLHPLLRRMGVKNHFLPIDLSASSRGTAISHRASSASASR
jgi:hypothetical protein